MSQSQQTDKTVFGIHSFETHIDLIDARYFNAFKDWCGQVKPAFAGRNFIGGDFLWGRSEATNSSSSPNPQNPENLQLKIEYIAPIQAPQPRRQEILGSRGLLYGKIDAQAICRRVSECIQSGEFEVGSTKLVTIWLAISDEVNLSADYLAGWLDVVFNYTYSSETKQFQPFWPGILCRYTADSNGILRRDPRVNSALTKPSYMGLTYSEINSYHFWAYTTDTILDGSNPNLDDEGFKNKFKPEELPLILRFSITIKDVNGNKIVFPFNFDVTRSKNEGGFPTNAYMLKAKSWQPSRNNIKNIGFSDLYRINQNDLKNCIMTKEFPDLIDNSGRSVSGSNVSVIGRYLRIENHGQPPIRKSEAEMLSNNGINIFTVWQSYNELVGGFPSIDPRSLTQWTPYERNIHKNIFYFDPVHHAGTEDATNAFNYVSSNLNQPPQTPIFFAADFDPRGLNVPSSWPNLPSINERFEWIKNYFQLIKNARDSFYQQNDRFYLIGIYSCGEVLQLLYEQGIVSYFWQSVSSGFHGSRWPNYPWYHSNRWQYSHSDSGTNSSSFRGWGCSGSADADADWMDGGYWSLTNPLLRYLNSPHLYIYDLQKKYNNLLELNRTA